MSKQTAVEWLQVQLNENGKLSAVDFYQAKQMEKQQIIDAYHINPLESKWENIGEQYYYETFKTEEK